ncbi:MAG: adenylate/guanylate cyclase domain-containing protein [Anaerosomatales bacterium]|nr:adenylate/guanylate cyclase domain-containing protein [Anaerosomatales bacterium]MDT8434052.1 adenylate/guanylate cyclase domain-containing protein [Anaerosomatales bacterium]
MRRTTFKNERVYRWVHGALFAGLLWSGLTSLSFAPEATIPFLALATGIAAVLAPAAAVLMTAGLIALPLLAADLVTGLVFLILSVVLFPFLARHSGGAFLVVAYGVLLAYAGPAWAVVAVAGLLFGSSGGAALAALACIATQLSAGLAGLAHAGVVASGAPATASPVLSNLPGDMLDLAWLQTALEAADPSAFLAALPGAATLPLFVLQPLAWAAGAAVTGAILRPAGSRYRTLTALVAAPAGVAVAATAHLVVLGAYDALPPVNAAAALSASLGCALLVSGVRDWVFSPVVARRLPAQHAGIGEGADVDELLRLIASAEDTLASQHATTATVLITDVQAFSALTERHGSLASARLIQRQRDLLVPVIETSGGRCKSTGGDGLVAAFTDPQDALAAAAEMQRALERHNAAGKADEAIVIRVGIATGELVLDRGGRPFIGSAINLAARIMDHAEGGQVLVSGEVAEEARAAALPVASHGTFELKNMSVPVEIVEVLWKHAPARTDTIRSGRSVLSALREAINAKAPA